MAPDSFGAPRKFCLTNYDYIVHVLKRVDTFTS